MTRAKNIIAAAALAAGLGAGLVAAGPVQAQSESAVMKLGSVAAPPRGFLDLCRRDAASCAEGQGPEAIAEAQRQTEDASKNYWLTRVRMAGPGPGATSSAGESKIGGGRMIARPTGSRGWRERGALGSRATPRWSPPVRIAPVQVLRPEDNRLASSAASHSPAMEPGSAPMQPSVQPPAGGSDLVYKPLVWGVPAWSVTLTLADRLSAPAPRQAEQATSSQLLSAPLAASLATLDAGNDRGWLYVANGFASRPAILRSAIAVLAVLPAEAPQSKPASLVERDGALWGVVSQVNTAVNRAIKSQSDLQGFGQEDVWQSSANGPVTAGDCEDFVVEKRRRLLAAGVPAAAMSVAIVKTPWRETHAVLLVATSDGDYVLDNITPWIVRWTDAGYQWDIRQAPGRPLEWVRIASTS